MTFQRTQGASVLPVGDQAQALRGLMDQLFSQRAESVGAPPPARAATIAVTSGKGGVGKTNVALNVAIGLARLGAATCVIDANLGLGNVDLLCGLNGYWNLSHVISGARTLREVILAGPEGIDVVPGAGGLTDLADWPPAVRADVFRQLTDLEQSHDFLIIDTAAGIHRSVRAFLEACDLVLVVTTPEPTSVADAYSTIKSLAARESPRIEILVNQCESARQARIVIERIQQTARLFLQTEVEGAGFLTRDECVAAAVAHRKPLLIEYPRSAAATAICQLALRLQRFFESQPRRGHFFTRMQNQRGRAPA